jgi:hypothetical protein
MGIRAAEYSHVKHVGQYDIGWVNGIATHSLISIHPGEGLTYDFSLLPWLWIFIR